MTRRSNSKILGLALAAMLAMSAMAASAAQATTTPLQATASSYPAILTGSTSKHKEGEAEPFTSTFTTSGGAVLSCKKTLTVATLTAPTENLVALGEAKECSAKIGPESLPVTVTNEDCYGVGHGGATESPNSDTFKEGTGDLVCPEGKTVVAHIYKNAADHTANKALCTLKTPPFVNKGSGKITNVTGGGPDYIILTGTMSGIPVTREGSLLCGAANQTATATGSTTVKAYEDLSKETPSNGTLKEIVEGNQIGLTASETP